MSGHNKVEIDLDKPYQEDAIDIRWISISGIILFAVIVLGFVLMWWFQYWILKPSFDEADAKNANPMALSEKDRLPQGPRLQSAPGFAVEGKNGKKVNLELREPQAEYEVLKEKWDDELKNGEKDEKTGTIIALPIEEAKEKLLKDETIKAKDGEEGKKNEKEAEARLSSANSGR